MLKRIFFSLIVSGACYTASAQELQARVTVSATRISNKVDKKIFQTLQTGLTNFVNNRKWSTDNFQPNEKIQCSFLLSIEEELDNNIYRATLTVQSARPVFNTAYNSSLINFIDENLSFRYQEFQPIEFNENRIQGSDPAAANLTAVFAYYVNIVLGLDYDSYSLRGGDVYFKRAMNIVNNSPEGANISGWKPTDGLRNRYWLAENLNSNRFALIHDAIYTYYRKGMDALYEKEENGRNGMLAALNFMNTLNKDNPNSMIVPFFMQGKSSELTNLFAKASADQKGRAKDILTKIDITNAAAYKKM